MSYFYNPVRAYFGKDGLENLHTLVSAYGGVNRNILLITRGRDLKESAEYGKILSQLGGNTICELDFVCSNPDISDVCDLIDRMGAFDYDIIVGVGGGSVLDISKAAAAFKGLSAKKPEQVRKLIESKSYASNRKVCPWIGIPTTSGTGSEVTPWATIWDKEKGLKYSIEGANLFALGAVIDPAFTLKLPMKTTVSTALDALCHAAEAYWSRKTNAVSRIYSLSAIESISICLEKLMEEPVNEDYREKIALASFYAGMAFSNTKTTACHSISYPLTMLLGIDHGIAACMTLAGVLHLNENALMEKEKLFKAFGILKSLDLENNIMHILSKAGIPTRLRDYNATPDILAKIVENAYTKGRMDNNPVDLDRHMLKNMLEAIL